MEALPARLIAHVFAKQTPSRRSIATLRAQLAQVCAERGADLVDLLFDTETPSRRPADYPSLVRIAHGEADGIMLTRLPLAFVHRKSRDHLCAVLEGPLMILTAEELRTRGLLPVSPAQRKPDRYSQPLASESDSREPSVSR